MKTPQHAIDRKKFVKFLERVQRDAKRLFPDEEGGSLVEVRMRDCTREAKTDGMVVFHSHNIETDAEWRDAIGALSVNVQGAAQRLDVYLRLFHEEQRRREGFAALQDEVLDLSGSLCVDINIGHDCRPPKGMRWARPFADFLEKNEAMVQIRNLFSYNERSRNDLLSWLKAVIEKWLDKNHPPEAKHLPPPFWLTINSDIAHLYVAVPVRK